MVNQTLSFSLVIRTKSRGNQATISEAGLKRRWDDDDDDNTYRKAEEPKKK